MAFCPSCRAATPGPVAHCAQCGAYLGSRGDFANFLAFWAAIVGLIAMITLIFGIAPNRKLAQAVSLVKSRDLDGVGMIGQARQDGQIQPLGWDADDFGKLLLVAFTYVPLKDQKLARRLAVWWAIEPDKDGTPPKVSSVDEFADKYLLKLALADLVPEASKEAERIEKLGLKPRAPVQRREDAADDND